MSREAKGDVLLLVAGTWLMMVAMYVGEVSYSGALVLAAFALAIPPVVVRKVLRRRAAARKRFEECWDEVEPTLFDSAPEEGRWWMETPGVLCYRHSSLGPIRGLGIRREAVTEVDVIGRDPWKTIASRRYEDGDLVGVTRWARQDIPENRFGSRHRQIDAQVARIWRTLEQHSTTKGIK